MGGDRTQAAKADKADKVGKAGQGAGKRTFAYLAHESNHAPLEVPAHYIDGGCAAGIPVRKGMIDSTNETRKGRPFRFISLCVPPPTHTHTRANASK